MKTDYNDLRIQLQRIAKDDLTIISSSSLKLYNTDVKREFVKHVSSQINKIYNEYVDLIPDNKQMEFLDLKSGYVISMKEWINNNPINIIPYQFIEEEDEKRVDESNLRDIVKRREVQIVAAGTALSIIFFASGLKLWALLAESAAIGLGIYEYRNQIEIRQVHSNQKKQKFQEDINNYISSVETTAMDWIKQAEDYSNQLLSKFV